MKQFVCFDCLALLKRVRYVCSVLLIHFALPTTLERFYLNERIPLHIASRDQECAKLQSLSV